MSMFKGCGLVDLYPGATQAPAEGFAVIVMFIHDQHFGHYPDPVVWIPKIEALYAS
jgi:hypothetical protein